MTVQAEDRHRDEPGDPSIQRPRGAGPAATGATAADRPRRACNGGWHV